MGHGKDKILGEFGTKKIHLLGGIFLFRKIDRKIKWGLFSCKTLTVTHFLPFIKSQKLLRFKIFKGQKFILAALKLKVATET